MVRINGIVDSASPLSSHNGHGVLSISTSGRPCKTLFISSYSIHFNPCNPNPNSENPVGFVTIFTEIRQFSPQRPLIFLDHLILHSIDDREQHPIHEPKCRILPFEHDFSSLCNWTSRFAFRRWVRFAYCRYHVFGVEPIC